MQRGETPWNWISKVLKCEKWNISTDKAQRADEKNGVICLAVMFTPRVMVIRMSKIAHFCVFCWWQQKISTSFGKNILHLKDLFEFFQKMVWSSYFVNKRFESRSIKKTAESGKNTLIKRWYKKVRFYFSGIF